MDNFQLVSITKISGNPTTIILLKNKKDIAVCTTNGFLLIYNIKLIKPKLCKEIINNDIVNNIQIKKTILDIIELQESHYCISCWDYKLRIIELTKNNTECNIIQTLTDHKNYINGLKRLNYYQNEIVFSSGSSDGKILLWKLENKSYFKFKEIECIPVEDILDSHYQIEGLEESIKYHQLICSYSLSECIFFCNLDNTQEIVLLKMKVNRCIRALKIIENGDFLIVAGNKEINIVNVELKTILLSIKYGIGLEFNCIFQKKD